MLAAQSYENHIFFLYIVFQILKANGLKNALLPLSTILLYGTTCAPLLADLLFYTYEIDLLESLVRSVQGDLLGRLHLFLVLCDHLLKWIYPSNSEHTAIKGQTACTSRWLYLLVCMSWVVTFGRISMCKWSSNSQISVLFVTGV